MDNTFLTAFVNQTHSLIFESIFLGAWAPNWNSNSNSNNVEEKIQMSELFQIQPNSNYDGKSLAVIEKIIFHSFNQLLYFLSHM